jgi:hypothetical protein
LIFQSSFAAQHIGQKKAASPDRCEFGDNFSIRSDLSGFVAGLGAGSIRAYGEINADGLRMSRASQKYHGFLTDILQTVC